MSIGEETEQRWRALMAEAQDGEAASYRRLLTEITPYLRRLARGRVPPGCEPEDVVQECLIAVHLMRHTYDPDRPFRPWLAAILHHKAADAARAAKRRRTRETEAANEAATFDAVSANTHKTEMADELSSVQDAMADLPPGQRHAVELLKIRGLSLKEASEETGMSISALKVAVHRGVARLRRLMARNDET